VEDTNKSLRKPILAAELIIAALTCVFFSYIATGVHLIMVDRPAATDISGWHAAVLAGEASSPNQYRPGAYLLAELIKQAFFREIYSAYFYERMLFTFATGFFSFVFFRQFLPTGWSFAAIGWFYAVLPQTYIGYGHQPADPINATFFVLAYLAMASRAPSWVVPVTAVGMFFRETALLLPLFGLMVEYDQRPVGGVLARFVTGIVTGLVVYFAIRYFYGSVEHPDPWIMVGRNIEGIGRISFFIPLLLLPAGLAIWGWKGLEPFLKRGLLFALLFIIIHFIFGRFGETRLILPILPLLIVSAMVGLKQKLGER
jgi:hypothetical protein